jgi:hypothetical protein
MKNALNNSNGTKIIEIFIHCYRSHLQFICEWGEGYAYSVQTSAPSSVLKQGGTFSFENYNIIDMVLHRPMVKLNTVTPPSHVY